MNKIPVQFTLTTEIEVNHPDDAPAIAEKIAQDFERDQCQPAWVIQTPRALDLAKLHRDCDEVRKTAFFGMRHSLRLSAEELKHTGSKSQELAAISAYRHAEKEIDKLTQAYLKKYPD